MPTRAPLPTLIDAMNAEDDRYLKNTTAKQAIDVNGLKLEVEKLNQLHQIASSAVDQPSYDRARATVGKLLGPDALAEIPEAYDPAMVEQFKRELVPIKDQIELHIKQQAADNPFGKTLTGKIAAARAAGNEDVANTLLQSVNDTALMSGRLTQDGYGNMVPANAPVRPGLSGMMGRPQILDTQLPEMPQGNGMVQTPTAAPMGAPAAPGMNSPKANLMRLATDESIREDAAKKANERDNTFAKRGAQASEMNRILDEAENYLDNASGSIAGSFGSAIKSGVGSSDLQTQSDAALATLSGWLTSNVPRMEGPQSNYDVENYKIMAGKIGNPRVPAGDKKEAMKVIRFLNEKYADSNQRPQSRLNTIIPKSSGARRKYNPATGRIE